jgi:predicted Co/Zn/Cd cation transporter (cation efflux family)
LPTLYLIHTLLFLLLMAFLVFLGTEVLEARHLLLRGAIFLVVAIFAIATCFLGFLRGGVSARLRKLYAGVSLLFLFSMIAVQVSRAIEVYPEMRRVQRVTEWFVPKLNRLAWWEGIRGPMHDFEYLVATIVILVIVLIGFVLALRKSADGGSSLSP